MSKVKKRALPIQDLIDFLDVLHDSGDGSNMIQWTTEQRKELSQKIGAVIEFLDQHDESQIRKVFEIPAVRDIEIRKRARLRKNLR